jgi:uncharacterized protein (TIGR02246 family)
MKHVVMGLIFLAGGFVALTEYQSGAACPRGPRFVPVTQAAPFVSEAPATALALAAQAPAKEEQDPAKKVILANVKSYMEAFNRQDVKAILALFTDDCEVIESDGSVVRGLKELEADIKDEFSDEPRAKISVEVDSIRLITSDVAIEEGKTTYYPDGKTITAETQYQVTHVKKGDRWLMSQARSFNREVLSPYDRLRDLEWLVGDWVDEGADSLIESSYRWDANKTFLLQDFTIRVKGRNVLKGTQRIGWDPLSKQIKSWVFDSEGGHAESLWNQVDDSWIIKAKGVRFDGKVVTMTNQLTQLGKDRMKFDSLDRITGEERMPAMSAVAVRRPPAARD